MILNEFFILKLLLSLIRDDATLKRGQLLSEEAYLDALEEYGDDFEARMGAEAVQNLLREIDTEAKSPHCAKNCQRRLLKPILKVLPNV